MKKLIEQTLGIALVGAALLSPFQARAADANLAGLTEATTLAWSNLLYAVIGPTASDDRMINVSNFLGALKTMDNWNRIAIYTNYIQTSSNFVFSFSTNRYELKNQTNIVFTNIVEEATASGANMAVHLHNTTAATVGLAWPAYGAQHGYFFQTNANNPILTTLTLAAGAHGVASFTAFGTNIFATFTAWP